MSILKRLEGDPQDSLDLQKEVHVIKGELHEVAKAFVEMRSAYREKAELDDKAMSALDERVSEIREEQEDWRQKFDVQMSRFEASVEVILSREGKSSVNVDATTRIDGNVQGDVAGGDIKR